MELFTLKLIPQHTKITHQFQTYLSQVVSLKGCFIKLEAFPLMSSVHSAQALTAL